MSNLYSDLKCLKRAVKAVQKFPGAAAAGYGALKRLRGLYARHKARFTPATIRAIQECRLRLPRHVELVECPGCHGMGTQHWMISYKHVCDVCGGWKMVLKTKEAVDQIERTWGRAGK